MMLSRSRLVANRLKRRSLNRSLRRNSHSPGKKTNIVVAVRIRPENEREQGSSSKAVQVLDSNILIFDPTEDEEDKFFFQGVRQSSRDLLKRPHKNLPFSFDYVFDGSSSNEDIFNLTTNSIIDRLLNGFNSSVFAYGATGSGKTYTMIGTPENPGIIFLMVMALFQRIEQLEDKVCDVSISYLEVYNETIKDLLTPSPPLAIREDHRGLVVSGLSHFKPNNADHLMQLLHFGNKNRTQHPTDANSESSRSHAVFQVYVRQKDKVPGLSANVRMAKMSLIDLAGSERATVVNNREKARLREGASINQSLLALGSCINALADRKNKQHHIPYRNSKLTRILKDSLGGNCFTVMIAALSPSYASYEDTYNTLKYADRAKGIKINLKHNVVNVDAHVSKYVKIVEAHQNEIIDLKAKLEKYEKLYASEVAKASVAKCSTGTMTNPMAKIALVTETEPKAGLLPLVLSSLHAEKQILRERYLDCESTLRLMKAKKNWKQDIQRLHNILSGEHKVSTTMDTLTKTMDLKEKRLLNERSQLGSLLADIQNKLDQATPRDDAFAVEKLEYQELHLKHAEKTLQMKHFLAVASLKSKHEDTYKSVVESLAAIVRKQQYILKGRSVLSQDLVNGLESVISQLHGVKEVNWADQSSPKNKFHQDVPDLYRLLPDHGESLETPVALPCITLLPPQDNASNVANQPPNSLERRASPVNGWCSPYSVNHVDQVRRSLDEAFANSPIPACSNAVLNVTFSPAVLKSAISTPDEHKACSLLNRTFTPVYDKGSSSNTVSRNAPPQTGISQHTSCKVLPSDPSLPEINTEIEVQAQAASFQSSPRLTLLTVKDGDAEKKTYVQKKPSVLASNGILQAANRQNAERKTAGAVAKKIAGSPWLRPILKMKAKENRSNSSKQSLNRQTSFLPRPGTLPNKQKQVLHRASSTPALNKHNP